MKTLTLQKLIPVLAGFFILSIAATGCKKDSISPDTGNGGNTGVHNIDPRLAGNWMWTKGSDGAYYDDNGVYHGAAYGFAFKYSVNADGSGTCFSHVFSTIGAGTYLEVNISYKGFYETDDEGHLGFFPTSGTYKSTSGENRKLRADELWNKQTKTGRSLISQGLTFTTQGGHECFQVTSSGGATDTFFKIP